uniref:Uncharacterized protein n=1 Tax=Cacopsylla melanoneura TaxID=428564 RepID=A0A8D8YJV2_9HEMI
MKYIRMLYSTMLKSSGLLTQKQGEIRVEGKGECQPLLDLMQATVLAVTSTILTLNGPPFETWWVEDGLMVSRDVTYSALMRILCWGLVTKILPELTFPLYLRLRVVTC